MLSFEDTKHIGPAGRCYGGCWGVIASLKFGINQQVPARHVHSTADHTSEGKILDLGLVSICLLGWQNSFPQLVVYEHAPVFRPCEHILKQSLLCWLFQAQKGKP